MATLLEIYNLRKNQEVWCRVSSAVAKAATDVLNESGSTTHHTERVVWANKAKNDLNAWTDKFMWDVSQNATIQSSGAACSDNDLLYVVNSSIDQYALNP